MSRILPLAALVVLLAGCDEGFYYGGLGGGSGTPPTSAKKGEAVTVMTRNIYLGAELAPIFSAAPDQVPFAAASVWAQIQATNFPRRAGLLAQEIAGEAPALVGLQEVISYYVQSPGDAALGGTTRATTIRYDFLATLLDSLARRGVQYIAVSRNTNSDVEMPVYTGNGPVPFDDVRFIDSDVILARVGVTTSNPQSGNYTMHATVPAGGGTIDQLRGWSSVDVRINALSFRFMNTHLETQDFADVQASQVAQLLSIADQSPLPIVLTGDLNSAADGSQTPTYSKMILASFVDAWDKSKPGYTCCNLPDLSNTTLLFDQRLDLVMTRGFADVKSKTEVIGDKLYDFSRGNIWPSDHAGVVAHLTLLGKQ